VDFRLTPTRRVCPPSGVPASAREPSPRSQIIRPRSSRHGRGSRRPIDS
jgi:hypothetical protein